MYVCLCRGVTETDVCKALEEGHRTLNALQDTLGVATCCGCCLEHVVHLLHHAQQSPVSCSVQPDLSCAAVS